jgi:rhamnose utilization protein RhaD (predicted bifunctional aldolase and dehydrogenase)/NAD(P)-dependent dehydrogenase (short-subunit alcohol dehydrogenase family)
MPTPDRWSDAALREALVKWGPPWGEDLAARTYSARLIGADPTLVLHGGGNTSVKSEVKDLLGEPLPALFVKGSGSDLARVEPPDHPGVALAELRRLRALPELSDKEMVRAIRRQMLDPSGPQPSIETLLHAWLPHKFVDHSHADAIVALTNTSAGDAPIREALGERVAIVPYVKPGFSLARLAAAVFERDPGVEAMVLVHHGLFTFGETAEESYRQHIRLVRAATEYLESRAGNAAGPVPVDAAGARARAARVAPLLRGALAERDADGVTRRFVLCWRGGERVLERLAAPQLGQWAATGTLTPEHVIRTKAHSLLVEPPSADGDGAWREAIRGPLDAFRLAYARYFEENARAAGGIERYLRLDDAPRVILVRGVGLFGVGATPGDAAIAADIAEHTLDGKRWVSAVGSWRALSPAQLFEIEYWSLEQAKLSRRSEGVLERRVALVTGAAGAIGRGVARELLAAGASVVLVDVDEAGLEAARAQLGRPERTLVQRADVTDPASMEQAFDAASLAFGGVDVVVPNAGIARTGPLGEMDPAEFRRVVEVNLTGVFVTLQQAARHLRRQGSGGGVVVVSSKNVFAPGEEFGAYSASKAGAHQLGRVAALELARDGIRVNMVLPDGVFADGDDLPSRLWQAVGPGRARAHGIEPDALAEHYRRRNLLRARISATHVGRAVVFFAAEQTPTTGAALPVDGGLPAAFPR